MRFFQHFCFGCVKVRLSGLAPERFLNLCGGAGLEVWNVCAAKDGCELYMGIRDFFSCRPFVKKAKVRLRILKKCGLPFFLHKNRRRKMWAAGFALFFIFLYVLSLFVWDIKYQGNLTYTDDELGHFLESLSVTNGTRKTDISCNDLEEALRNRFGGITWVSARLSGTRLYVQIKENEVPLEIPEKDETPCDLTAAFDGVITSMIVRSGVPLVKTGDTVEKGQLLVSGRVPITDDAGEVTAEHFVRADADIIGRIRRTQSKEINLWHRREEKTGNIRRGLFLSAAGHSFVWLLPNLKKTEWKTVMEEKKLCLFKNFVLPVRYGFITSFEVSSHDQMYGEEELSNMAEQYKNEISENLIEKGVQIIENNVRILVNGSFCRFEAELLTEEPIDERSTIN